MKIESPGSNGGARAELARIRRVVLVSLMVVGGATVTPAWGVAPLPDTELPRLGLVKYWDLALPLAEHDAVRAAWRLDDALYIAATSGVVYALDPVVGLIRWAEPVSEANVQMFPPTHVMNAARTGPVLFVTATTLQVRDRYTGQLQSRSRPSFAPSAPVVGVEQLLVGCSAEGVIQAFVVDAPGGRDRVKLWELASGPVSAAPVLFGEGTLLVATQQGRVFSFRVLDKALNWSAALGGGVVGDPAVDVGGVYVASLDRSLYKFDPNSGAPIWRFRTSAPLRRGPILAGAVAVQPLGDQGLIAVDSDGGKERWRHEAGTTMVGRSAEVAYLLATGPKLESVSLVDGAIRGSIDVPAVATVVTNGSDDFVFLLSAKGSVLCARPEGVPHLRPADAALARQRLNRPPGSSPAAAAATSVQPSGKSDAEDPFRSRRDR